MSIGYWAAQATQTRHPVVVSKLGTSSDEQNLIKSFTQGGTVELTTIIAADWEVPLSGVLNLKHSRAKDADLVDRPEPIQIYAYYISHPKFGDYLIDTGVSKEFFEDPESLGVPKWLVPQLNLDQMSVLSTTQQILTQLDRPLKGVFLTHLHLDHISGLPEIARNIPIYVGLNETRGKYWLYAATRGTTDQLLQGRPALQEWQSRYIDIFGDGSVFAIHLPGHTPGSTAYLVNSTSGPILLTGDVSHTAWGWRHDVEPGLFSRDRKANAESLHYLVTLVDRYPEIEVKLGHQML